MSIYPGKFQNDFSKSHLHIHFHPSGPNSFYIMHKLFYFLGKVTTLERVFIKNIILWCPTTQNLRVTIPPTLQDWRLYVCIW